MEITGKALIGLMNSLAPAQLAEHWDNPGLQIGNPSEKVQRVLVALDVTEENIAFAEENHIQMIIAHHPFLFKALHKIDGQTAKGQMISRIIKNDILIFAAHTNLDTADGGVNDALADALGLIRCEGLVPVSGNSLMKLTANFGGSISESLIRELKSDSSVYAAEFSDEGKVQIRIKKSALSAVLPLLMSYHPKTYETVQCMNYPEYDFMGRIGELEAPLPGMEALQFIKNRLGIPVLKYCGNPEKTIRKIAVLGGAGAEFASLAKTKGADLYLTGDVKYHEAQDAAAEGILMVDGGHYYTERVIVPYLSKFLREAAQKNQWDLTVYEDQGSSDIFRYI